MKRNFLPILLLAVLISACGGRLPASPTPTAPAVSQFPQAWIDSPLNGSTLPLGEVEIVSHAASLAGIAQVELSVNDVVIRTDANPSPSETLNLVRQIWLPGDQGNYQISVRAKNTLGEWSAPSKINVIIQGVPTQIPTVTLPLTPTPTSSATATVTPSETPSPTPTASPAGPPVIVLVRNSFCRLGPGQDYREITALAAGDTAEVLGISQDRFWLFVLWPKFNVRCWIAAYAAPPDVDLSGVPVRAAPPTPTPTGAVEATAIPSTPAPTIPLPTNTVPPTETPYKP